MATSPNDSIANKENKVGRDIVNNIDSSKTQNVKLYNCKVILQLPVAESLPQKEMPSKNETKSSTLDRGTDKCDQSDSSLFSKDIACQNGLNLDIYEDLYWAALEGNLSDVDELLRNNVPVDYEVEGLTPLLAAVKNGYLSVVQTLLHKGANANFKTKEGESLLTIAAKSNNKDILESLLQYYDKSKKDLALFYAALRGHYDIVLILLKYGMSPEFGDEFTPMYAAAQEGHFNIVKLLAEQNANVFAKTSAGNSAISTAAQNGHKKIVQYLLTFYKGNSSDGFGLYAAAVGGHNDIIKMFLDHGFPVDCSFHGSTPLSAAAYKGHLDTVKLLLEYGANINGNKYSPLSEAAENGHRDIVNYLRQYIKQHQ